jgi:murein DD-endopeptidase MepM/ murein hydrolase activator NlpD
MPEGTPICAARAGVVMDVAGDFFEGGRSAARYGARANYVRILHDDGTMAVYAHLKLESIRVRLGAKVSRGQVIASSGNTGYSSGPHLHFAVERNAGMRLASVPFRFDDGSGTGVEPATSQTLGH